MRDANRPSVAKLPWNRRCSETAETVPDFRKDTEWRAETELTKEEIIEKLKSILADGATEVHAKALATDRVFPRLDHVRQCRRT